MRAGALRTALLAAAALCARSQGAPAPAVTDAGIGFDELTCSPGATVASNASAGSVFVDGGALKGVTAVCEFRIGASNANTSLYSVLNDGDSGFTTLRIYGAAPALWAAARGASLQTAVLNLLQHCPVSASRLSSTTGAPARHQRL